MWFKNNQYARHRCFLSTFIWIFRCFSFMKIYLLVLCKVGVYCTSFEMHGASLEIFASIRPWSSSRTFLAWCTPFSLAIFVSLSKCRFFYGNNCRNPSFGLETKAKGLQGCEPRGSPGVTSHTPESVAKCEGVNPHTPKATPTLGDGVPVDSRDFRERFEGSKLNGFWISLYHWKALETEMSKMSSHCSFGHLKHKLWPKEGPGVELPVWLPTRKSRESTRFT